MNGLDNAQRNNNMNETVMLEPHKTKPQSQNRLQVDEGTPSSELYTYASLASNQHIRILELEPSHDHRAPLRFSFRTENLQGLLHQYEAISYTWGNLSFPDCLHCVESNTIIPITRNLDAALRRFRDRYETRNLWADAVCINQNDDVEKAIQIPIMRDIYQTASSVLVWLGDGDVEENALQVLCAVSRGTLTFLEGENGTADVAAALDTITRLPYFKRRWIIQEVASNSDISLFCGKNCISWIRFMAANAFIQHTNLEKFSDSTRLNTITTLISLWQSRTLFVPEKVDALGRSGPELTILHLMDKFEDTDCSNPRDRLYALYSLANNTANQHLTLEEPEQWNILRVKHLSRKGLGGGPIPLAVDYSLPCESIYQMFAASAMATSYGLDILAAAALRKGSSNLALPSWVPDWALTTRPKLPLRLTGGLHHFYMVNQTYISIRVLAYNFEKGHIPKVVSLFSPTTTHDHNQNPDREQSLGVTAEDSDPGITVQKTAFGILYWSKGNRVELRQIVNELGIEGLDNLFIEQILEKGLKFKYTLNDQSTWDPTLISIERIEGIEKLQPAYKLFVTDVTPPDPDSGRCLAFVGITNAAITKGDSFLTPFGYNFEYDTYGQTPYIHSLVLRRVKRRSRLIGFTYLIPVVGLIPTKQDNHNRLINHEPRWEAKVLYDFQFSKQLVTVELE